MPSTLDVYEVLNFPWTSADAFGQTASATRKVLVSNVSVPLISIFGGPVQEQVQSQRFSLRANISFSRCDDLRNELTFEWIIVAGSNFELDSKTKLSTSLTITADKLNLGEEYQLQLLVKIFGLVAVRSLPVRIRARESPIFTTIVGGNRTLSTSSQLILSSSTVSAFSEVREENLFQLEM